MVVVVRIGGESVGRGELPAIPWASRPFGAAATAAASSFGLLSLLAVAAWGRICLLFQSILTGFGVLLLLLVLLLVLLVLLLALREFWMGERMRPSMAATIRILRARAGIAGGTAAAVVRAAAKSTLDGYTIYLFIYFWGGRRGGGREGDWGLGGWLFM